MFIKGTYSILYIDSGDGFYPVGCLTSNSFQENTDSLDSTTRDNDGWKTNRLTGQGYSISFSGLVLEDEISFTKQTYYDLKTIKRNRTLIDWKINDKNYGSGYIVDLSNEDEIDSDVTFSAELTGYGKPLIKLDVVFDAYKTRAEVDGATIENEKCLKKYIDSII